MTIWADLEARREAAIAASVIDGRGRTSLVQATADKVIEAVKSGELKPDKHGIISITMRDGLGKKAALKFETVQRENAKKAGLSDERWYIGQDMDDQGKLQVTLNYMPQVD